MSETNPIVGIDLGTTFSAVSIVRQGQPTILPNGEERIIPSVVGLSQEGKWLVGTPARNQWVLAPEATVRSIKREMGSEKKVNLGQHTFTPQEISAFILRELKRIAEINLGAAIERAVITVPAYFSDAQRQATKDAGQIAGLEVVRIINEPTSAALAYGLDRAQDQTMLVYDLGGGTFDVSLVELNSGIVEVRSSHGNTKLGGDDFDARLADYLLETFEKQHHIDLRGERRAVARLNRAAEQAKIALSTHPFAWVREEYLAEKNGVLLHLELEISRVQFEAMIQDLLLSTLTSIDRVLADAELTAHDLDKVLLVGGSTYIPAVWELVARHTGLEPRQEVHPEEAVALGAGVQAAIIAGEPIEAILVDVTPHSLGIEVAQVTWRDIVPDRYKVLVRRNTTIPVTKEEIFSAIFPEQDSVHVKVYQGESPIASQNVLLGDFLFSGLKPEWPGVPARVAVQFDLDVNGILRVQALDRGSGEETGITVTASRQRLTQEQIDQAQERLAGAVQAPVAAVDEEMAAERGALVKRARRLLDSGNLDQEDAEELRELLDEIERASQSDALQELMDDLLELLFDLEE